MVPSTMSARPPCCSRLVSLTVHQHLQPHTRASEHRATNKETNATKVGEDKQPWPISLAPSRLSNAPCVAPRSSLRPGHTPETRESQAVERGLEVPVQPSGHGKERVLEDTFALSRLRLPKTGSAKMKSSAARFTSQRMRQTCQGSACESTRWCRLCQPQGVMQWPIPGRQARTHVTDPMSHPRKQPSKWTDGNSA